MFWIMAAHWTPPWTAGADDILAFWAMMVSEIESFKKWPKLAENEPNSATMITVPNPFPDPAFFAEFAVENYLFEQF